MTEAILVWPAKSAARANISGGSLPAVSAPYYLNIHAAGALELGSALIIGDFFLARVADQFLMMHASGVAGSLKKLAESMQKFK